MTNTRSSQGGVREGQRVRLAPGRLRRLVLEHLRRYPELDFSPTDLARAVGRPGSRGAVINACQQLTTQGLATRTQDQPQRYRAPHLHPTTCEKETPP